MALILTKQNLQKLDPPMAGAVAVIEQCCRIQASGDVTNHPRVYLAYPPTGETGKRAGFGNKTLPSCQPSCRVSMPRAFAPTPWDRASVTRATPC